MRRGYRNLEWIHGDLTRISVLLFGFFASIDCSPQAHVGLENSSQDSDYFSLVLQALLSATPLLARIFSGVRYHHHRSSSYIWCLRTARLLLTTPAQQVSKILQQNKFPSLMIPEPRARHKPWNYSHESSLRITRRRTLGSRSTALRVPLLV